MSVIEEAERPASALSAPFSPGLAEAYCAGAELGFSEAMARFALSEAEDVLPRHVRRVADIACGGGAACLVFGSQGLDVVGTDRSPHMVRMAEREARRTGARVRYLVQDYRDLALDVPVDLVTCMYDSLNFMPDEASLARLFASVRAVLVHPGAFIFDMYTLRGLAETWGTTSEIHTDSPDHFIATRTAMDYDGMTNTKILHGFTRADDGSWQRWEERHQIWAYPVARIEDLLRAAGLEPLKTIDWDEPGHAPAGPRTCRVAIVTRSL